MNYYAALDVSLRSIHICVMDEKGSIKAEGQTPSEVEDVMEFLGNLAVEITSVGFEAGTLTSAPQPSTCLASNERRMG